MISFRLSVIALSAALIFSVGSSASTATTNYSHPEFSVADSRTLNLQETGSQIVVETIENALRQGGLALLGEGFQLDSSLSYHSGDNEGIEGNLDVVIPLWNGGRHAIFTQPGLVFWKGLEGEKRFDGNLGLVYRAELTRNLIAGASIFYDHDFEIGHSRVSGGLDLQSGFFRFGANYYHPLSEVEDGREGFVEEVLSGMDARLVFEREAVRLGSTIGYWDYKGEESGGQEDSRSGWKTSIGLDFGIRILPGVFAEASWERHKGDVVLDERIFTGLAFRFSLPDFEGASYGSGEMTSNLYKIVDREKRILYEEREADNIILTPSGSVVEGGTVTVAVQLREASTEDVVINLVGSGTATYGVNGDWVLDNGSGNCSAVTGTSCQITITAGQTEPADNVVITINDDGRGEGAETIILSTTIASGDASLTSRALTLTIPRDLPLPTVSLSADSLSVAEGSTATLTLTLNEMLEENATFNLIGSGGATYGTDADWNLSVGGTDCDMANESNPCEVMIAMGDTTAEVIVEVNTDSINETTAENFTVSVVVDSGSTSIVQEGSRSSLNFTIPGGGALPTVSLNYSGPTTVPRTSVQRMRIDLSEKLSSPITVNITSTGSATYDQNFGIGTWWLEYNVIAEGGEPPVNFTATNTCPGAITSTGCAIIIPAGSTIVDLRTNFDVVPGGQTANFTLGVDSGIVTLGNQSTVNLTVETPPLTVSLDYSGSTMVRDQDEVRVTLRLSRPLTQEVKLNIVGDGSTATYGAATGNWLLQYAVLPEGGTPPSLFADNTNQRSCADSVTGNACQATIPAGATTVDIHVAVSLQLGVTSGTIVVSVEIPQESRNIVNLGSTTSVTFDIVS